MTGVFGAVSVNLESVSAGSRLESVEVKLVTSTDVRLEEEGSRSCESVWMSQPVFVCVCVTQRTREGPRCKKRGA